jgi:hypothetical protein
MEALEVFEVKAQGSTYRVVNRCNQIFSYKKRLDGFVWLCSCENAGIKIGMRKITAIKKLKIYLRSK